MTFHCHITKCHGLDCSNVLSAYVTSLHMCVPQEVQDGRQRENRSPQTCQLSTLLVRTLRSCEGHPFPIKISPRATHSRCFSAAGPRRPTEPRTQLEAVCIVACTLGYADLFSVSVGQRNIVCVCDRAGQAMRKPNRTW